MSLAPRTDWFQRTAAEKGIRAPRSILAITDADREEWDRYHRDVWRAAPPYAFCPHFIHALAEDHLPRVLGQMGIGQMLGRISPDAHRIVGRGAPFCALPRDPDGRWMMFRLTPDSADILALDDWTHAWRCPSLDQLGSDLIDLGAWRWGISAGKAAFRIARLCGRARPVP